MAICEQKNIICKTTFIYLDLQKIYKCKYTLYLVKEGSSLTIVEKNLVSN